MIETADDENKNLLRIAALPLTFLDASSPSKSPKISRFFTLYSIEAFSVANFLIVLKYELQKNWKLKKNLKNTEFILDDSPTQGIRFFLLIGADIDIYGRSRRKLARHLVLEVSSHALHAREEKITRVSNGPPKKVTLSVGKQFYNTIVQISREIFPFAICNFPGAQRTVREYCWASGARAQPQIRRLPVWDRRQIKFVTSQNNSCNRLRYPVV